MNATKQFRATYFSLITLLILFRSVDVPAADSAPPDTDDVFIAGQLTAVLEREFHWERKSYELTVRNGVAYVTSHGDEDHQPLPKALEIGISGLLEVHLVTDKSTQSETRVARRAMYSVLGLAEYTEPFPVDDIFEPLIADVKQPRLFAALREYDVVDTNGTTTSLTIGAVGFGETFGLYRRDGSTPGNGLQLSLSAGVFAQYNLDAESDDLINADYIVGFPITYRHDRHSARLRLYHQSSHLGDEFLLNFQPARINLSYESVEFLYSYDWDAWRAYFGGERIFSIEPADVKQNLLHGGLEFRSGLSNRRRGQWIVGTDVRSAEQHDWHVDWSLKAGYEFDAASEGQRLRILLEAYDGFTPHGQFYNTETQFYGFGFYFGY